MSFFLSPPTHPLFLLCTTMLLSCGGSEDIDISFSNSGQPQPSVEPTPEETSFGHTLTAEDQLSGHTEKEYFASALSTGDVDGDAQDDILVGAYGADTNGNNSGAAYLFTSSFSSAPAKLAFVGMEPKDHAGLQVLINPDFSGDGRGDVVIAAPYNKTIYLFRSQSINTLNTDSLGLDQADHTIIGENAGDYIGWSLASVDDMDGDGRHEILIGADGVDYGSFSGGMTYLLFSQTLSQEARFNIEISDRKFVGDTPMENSGQAISSGDLDGDGISDIIIGADGNDLGGENSGAVYINFGAQLQNLDLPLSISDRILFPNTPFAEAGSALASQHDANGDGYEDLLIGAPSPQPQSTNTGMVYLVLGGNIEYQHLEDAPFRFQGNYDNTGFSVSFVDDVDQDGRSEILIGAPQLYADTEGGCAYLWPSSTLEQGTMLVAHSPYAISGTQARSRMGYTVDFASFEDDVMLLVGAPEEDNTGILSLVHVAE